MSEVEELQKELATTKIYASLCTTPLPRVRLITRESPGWLWCDNNSLLLEKLKTPGNSLATAYEAFHEKTRWLLAELTEATRFCEILSRARAEIAGTVAAEAIAAYETKLGYLLRAAHAQQTAIVYAWSCQLYHWDRRGVSDERVQAEVDDIERICSCFSSRLDEFWKIFREVERLLAFYRSQDDVYKAAFTVTSESAVSPEKNREANRQVFDALTAGGDAAEEVIRELQEPLPFKDPALSDEDYAKDSTPRDRVARGLPVVFSGTETSPEPEVMMSKPRTRDDAIAEAEAEEQRGPQDDRSEILSLIAELKGMIQELRTKPPAADWKPAVVTQFSHSPDGTVKVEQTDSWSQDWGKTSPEPAKEEWVIAKQCPGGFLWWRSAALGGVCAGWVGYLQGARKFDSREAALQTIDEEIKIGDNPHGCPVYPCVLPSAVSSTKPTPGEEWVIVRAGEFTDTEWWSRRAIGIGGFTEGWVPDPDDALTFPTRAKACDQMNTIRKLHGDGNLPFVFRRPRSNK